MQQTLPRATENARRYQPGLNMRTWLLTIMRNRFLADARKSVRADGGVGLRFRLDPDAGRPRGQDSHMQLREMQVTPRATPQHCRQAMPLVGALGEAI